ncbi:hypothetical protein B5F76_10860 [Desulfovibrio sp. An276]|nr:hypothetical protein B5F76_10860 [Desulfovibrio sp. An276]
MFYIQKRLEWHRIEFVKMRHARGKAILKACLLPKEAHPFYNGEFSLTRGIWPPFPTRGKARRKGRHFMQDRKKGLQARCGMSCNPCERIAPGQSPVA